MKIVFLVTGKTARSGFSDGIGEYCERLKHYADFEMTVIPDLKNAKSLSAEQQKERLDADTRYNDRIITALRTMWGLDLDGVAADFGEERRAYCLRMAAPHLQAGLCECRDNRLRITPNGLFVSDGIMADLLYVG